MIRNRLVFFLAYILFATAFFSGCKKAGWESRQENTTPPKETPAVQVPRFDRDSAMVYLAKQLEFGPRVPNTEGHRQCRDWLLVQMETFGAKVIRQDFTVKAYTGENLKATNIIAQYRPEEERRILLAAHWDTRHISDSPLNTGDKSKPVMGADDGASGVAVLLEVARQLQQAPIDFGVDIVFFDVEDYGEDNGNDMNSWGMGAQHWARNLHYTTGVRPVYGILLDMVGGKGARFGKEQISLQYAAPVVNKIWSLAQNMGYGNLFVNDQVSAVTDDHYFVNTIAGIPMIDIISRPKDTPTGFPAHWHTDKDTLESIDPNTIRVVGQLMLAVIYREYAGTLQ